MKLKFCLGACVLLIGGLSSCQKDHELDKLDADYRVVTDYDPDANFASFQSYYLPDSVLFVGTNDRAEYLDSLQAKPILDAYHRNMKKRGYLRAACKEEADLGLQVTYIADTYHFVGYTASPYWWWGYADYWSPFYWGNWGNWGYWYYPHPVSFTVSTGALLTEMVNLKAPQGLYERLPVVWQSYLTGLLHGSNAVNVLLAARGVEQSFEQSPYIIKHEKHSLYNINH